jgi:SAM-dependent methyltransferase
MTLHIEATNWQEPQLSLGTMNVVEDEELLQEWDTLLNVQTQVLGGREAAWLENKGFGASRGVLEVGSASGHYGSFLARGFPHVDIFGLEANPHLARRFDRIADAPPNYRIHLGKIGEDPLPMTLEGRFDACILRFVLQHVSNPACVLRAVHDVLPPGGKIYVVEEDLTFLTTRQDWLPFRVVRDAWLKVTAASGTDGLIGAKLPALVEEAGFVVDDFDITLRNNVEMGAGFGDFMVSALRVFRRTMPDLVTDHEVRAAVAGFESSRTDHTHRHVATYPQFLLTATKKASGISL